MCWDEKGKATQQVKLNNTTRGNKSECTGKRSMTKKISRPNQTTQTKTGHSEK